MTETYKPDDRFLEHLEWQLASEFRRSNRLQSGAGKITVSRRLAVMSILVGVLTTGVTMIKAAEYFKDNWRKKIDIARVETEIKLKEAHLESTSAMAARVKARVSDGLVREEEYLRIRLAVDAAGLDLSRTRLNLEEVEMSGEIPRDELYAPVVGGRDFVTERLEFDKQMAELDLQRLNIRWERLNEMVKTGLVHVDELGKFQVDLDFHVVRIDKIRRRMELRSDYVEGKITAREVEIQGRTAAAESSYQLAQSKVDTLKRQLQRLESLAAAGVVSPTEVSGLSYALTAALAELEFAELELDVLNQLK